MSMTDITIMPSAVRAATTTSQDFNLGHQGHGVFTLDVTVAPGTDTVTMKVQGKDKTSGKYVDLLSTAAVSTVSTSQLEIGPGITASANASAARILPGTFRVVVTHSAATNFTYSVGASVKFDN